MGKARTLLTQESALTRWQAGVGQGERASYQPWIIVQNVPSHGMVSRVKGCKVPRIHHLLSKGELQYFFLLESIASIIDVREQFPLWSYDDTQTIADQHNIKHPKPIGTSNTFHVMTSDFRITTKNGGDFVRTFKTREDLSKRRTLEKLEIERLYWQDHKINWGIILKEDLPLARIGNWQLIREYYIWDDKKLSLENMKLITEELLLQIKRKPIPLTEITTSMDKKHNLPVGISLTAVWHLIANSRLPVDLNQTIQTHEPLKLLVQQ
jgi:hypothetical protein